MMEKIKDIENKLKSKLDTFNQMRIMSTDLQDPLLLDDYNDFAQIALDFFGEVALLNVRNRQLLRTMSMDPSDFAVDCTLELIKGLDRVLALPPTDRIRYIVTLANNQVIDKFRTFNNEIKHVIDLDEISWGQLESPSNTSQSILDRDLAQRIIQTACTLKPLELLSFLSINALDWKPSFVADKLIELGFESLLSEVIYATCMNFDLDNIKYKQNTSGSFEFKFNQSQVDYRRLTANISKSNFNAKNEIKKTLRFEN